MNKLTTRRVWKTPRQLVGAAFGASNSTPVGASIANWIFSQVVVRRVAQSADPLAQQTATLRKLLYLARNTQIGKEYDFANITDYADYRNKLPIYNYDSLWEKYWKDSFPKITDTTWAGTTKYFALSSGTSSGNTKYLPLSRQMNAANRRAALDLMAFHQSHNSGFRPFDGALLYLGGGTSLEQLAPGIAAGDLSAIATSLRPKWTNQWFAPPFTISDQPDWQSRYQMLLDYLATTRNITSISGVPMWIHKLLADTNEHKLPGLNQLKLVIHGGAAITPYLEDLHQLLPANCTRREVYPASEGFIAIDDSEAKDWYQQRKLRLNTSNGLFFEFIPVDQSQQEQPKRYWLGEIEIGETYALVLTSNAGIWSYLTGDLVRLESHNPARITFAGRTAWNISHYGEHLNWSDLTQALNIATKGNMPIHEWSFGLYSYKKTDGRHLLIVESEQGLDADFGKIFDSALQQCNSDYAHQRTTPFLPQPPIIWRVNKGSFDRLLTGLGKGGGQSKVPRIVHDLARFKSIYKILQQHLVQKIS